jgi:toxin HigB-1
MHPRQHAIKLVADFLIREAHAKPFENFSPPGVVIGKPFAIVRRSYYASRMIRSIKGAGTRQFVETGKAKFSGLDEALARRRLSALNAAQKLDDLSRLRSVGLHKLSGDRRGYWAISVNGPWRIVFRFNAGDVFEVEIVDYP